MYAAGSLRICDIPEIEEITANEALMIFPALLFHTISFYQPITPITHPITSGTRTVIRFVMDVMSVIGYFFFSIKISFNSLLIGYRLSRARTHV
jgi:hypothetical protein